MTKTIEELNQDKTLFLQAIDILDTITEEENNITRTQEDFQYYETWATSDIKKELTSKIGEIDVQIENINKTTQEETNNTEEETNNTEN